MGDITAIILTRNEESNIKLCIDSIRHIVKRIVVVDSYSEDNTVDIAQKLGAEVYQHEFYNYAKQYMYAVDIANVCTKWILRIDADERLTLESAQELEKLCRENLETDVNGIMLRFCINFLGREIRHGGMYPWKKLSVYKTGVGNIENRNMDEHIILQYGKVIEAAEDSKHLPFKGLTFFTSKSNWYSTREAMDFFDSKKGTNMDKKTWVKMNIYYKLPIGFRSWIYYIYRYYFRLGFLDGKEGKIFVFLTAYWYRFLVDAKIFEHEKLGEEFKPTGALRL
ncbi:glycosyltransferase family 2 protein [Clostridium ljungdahlii]|uniref:SPBc2 prophage-derived glycosyltransferase SunS n=1 Tax=Clostridium ljungdahlii TaxID=1538 RepID=A0A162LAU0_9CLOT|nr:glycosyltransferase family 2 protein [Clostridium ljungdahlii]OAA86968.1 SPBc2 prophage-derived glycosyltransferase SunS [Clostridium ljungdahlii]